MTQQTLREKIQQYIKCTNCNGVGSVLGPNLGVSECPDCGGDKHCLYEHDGYSLDDITDSILQQVIEWVDKEVIGEDEKGQIKGLGKELSNNVQGIRNTLRASQHQKLQQLKGEV